LEGVWENWSKDLARSKPQIIIHDFSDAIPEGCLLEQVIKEDYELVVSHPGYRVYSRQGMMEGFVRKLKSKSFQDWSSGPMPEIMIENDEVFVLQGILQLSDFSDHEILITDRDSRESIAAFKLTGLQEILTSRWSHGRYLKALLVPTDRPAGKYPFMLVIRNASAALLLDGKYVGGVPVGRSAMRMEIRTDRGGVSGNLSFWTGSFQTSEPAK
jgi:hypothetical protein